MAKLTTPRLTAPRLAALTALVNAYPGMAARSNFTLDAGPRREPTIYWQTYDWLVLQGYADATDDWFGHCRLTQAGWLLWESTRQAAGVKSWWHRYQGVCPHGILTALTMGGSPTPGSRAKAEAPSFGVATVACDDCETTVGYVRSWDHEPTDAEMEAVMPARFRDE